MRIPASILTLLAGMALVLTGLWVGQNVNLLPAQASANAPVYDELFKVLFSIGTILFVGIVGLIVYSLARFRRRAGETGDGLAIEGNLPLEILWTAIPAVVVLFVGIYSYDIYDRMGGMTPLNDHSMHAMAGSEERTWGGISPVSLDGDPAIAPLPVDVTAMQFAFIFHYPDSDITSGELHVPVGQPVALQMKALDVIHAFWVPQFRLKQDVIPGQPTLLSFTPTRPGQYPIVCAELCGPYHGGMRSSVIVEEPESFAAWVAKNSPAASATTTAVQS
ncbi:MAG: cytochrome c oxidase subunit II [Cyanobacteria bacterium K_DeepCast_35m_m2_023]|nr:cytochrome c oxidase subunit II [Cyanobacteria bacterium K_DeepCast_35m_m2_023]